jgi:hypothetical protein
VGQADFDVWKAHFGESLSGSGSGASLATGNGASLNGTASAAALTTYESTFGAFAGSSSVTYMATAYGPVGYLPTGSTSGAGSSAVTGALESDGLTATNLAFDALLLDGGTSAPPSTTAVGAQATSNSSTESTANANLLLIDQVLGDLDESTLDAADVSVYEDSWGEVGDVSDLALAAVLNDGNWWNEV